MNEAKLDRRVIAREFRQDLDEQVQDMETKGWEVQEDAEVNPFRPNPSSPPWPTVLMTRPIDHPQAIEDLRLANHELRNQVGEMTKEFGQLRQAYRTLAGVLEGPTFTDRGGMVRIQDEDNFRQAIELINELRDRYGPPR